MKKHCVFYLEVLKVQLTERYLLKFWYPLALTWIFMALEGPIIAGIIARLGDTKINLAAYGIAYAFALILEAPIIMLMSTSAALVHDRPTFKKIQTFTRILNAFVIGINMLILSPLVYHHLIGLLHVPRAVGQLTYQALILLVPWPVAIGFRRFYQGILIRQRQTRMIALGTCVRLLVMVTVCFTGFRLHQLAGAQIGALAMTCAVVIEALLIYHFARPIVAKLEPHATTALDAPGRTYLGICRFYYPLALTSFIGLTVQPFITFFVGQCRFPLESLAVMPVVESFIFVFKCVGLSFQEVAIVLGRKAYEDFLLLRGFATKLAVIFGCAIALVAFTPLAGFWFGRVAGLTPELSRFALPSLQVMALLPSLTILVCWLRANAINSHHNIFITHATSLEVLTMVAVMAVFTFSQSVSGALASSLALALGRTVSFGYLFVRRKVMYPTEQSFAPCQEATASL